MFSLSLPNNARFTNKQIFAFLIPVIFEHFMVALLGIADTFMVSFLGETAVAGVALVNRIDNFAKQFFIALAQGGSVVLSQYIGATNNEKSKTSLKDNIRIVVLMGLMFMLLMVCFKNGVLKLLFGGAQKEVLDISSTYFTVTAFSYPLVALYYAGCASFRAMGESRIPFISSFVMMIINLILKYLFIFHMNMGVTGAALSTLIAMGITGVSLIFLLKRPTNKVALIGFLKPDMNIDICKKILAISLPNGIEQCMFQLGALLIAGLVSGLGTAAIAADSLARTLTPVVHSISASFVAIMLVIVGQCMGADKPDEAVFYTKHILKLNYIMITAVTVVFVLFLRPIISIFEVSLKAQDLAFYIILIYSIFSCLTYPTSYALVSALRGAGDTKYVMVISTASMFAFRIGAAYIFALTLNMGIIGTWVAMVSDWLIRSFIFIVRFKKGKWKENKVI